MMDNETLRILCYTARESCRVELDGQEGVNIDKMPGLLLGLIDAYTIATKGYMRKTESEAE